MNNQPKYFKLIQIQLGIKKEHKIIGLSVCYSTNPGQNWIEISESEYNNHFLLFKRSNYPKISNPRETNKDSAGYKEGYETGLNWKYDYIPGGPFHYYFNDHAPKQFKQFVLESIENHKNWMAGFYDGLAKNPSKSDKLK